MFYSIFDYVVISGSISEEFIDYFNEKYNNSIKKKTLNNTSDKKIYYYQIKDKDIFILFLLEYKNNKAKKYGFDLSSIRNSEDVIKEINLNILKDARVNIGSKMWLMQDMKAAYRVLSNEKTENLDCFDQTINDKVNIFDQIINPFENKYFEDEDIDNILRKKKISVDTYTKSGVRNCLRMHISDTDTLLSTYRNPDGFSTSMHYNLISGNYVSFSHSFKTNLSFDKNRNGESITIVYYDEIKKYQTITYNISSQKVSYSNSQWETAKKSDKEIVINFLNKVIETINKKDDIYIKKLISK